MKMSKKLVIAALTVSKESSTSMNPISGPTFRKELESLKAVATPEDVSAAKKWLSNCIASNANKKRATELL